MLAISRLHGFPGESKPVELVGSLAPAARLRRRIFRVRQGRHSARMGRARGHGPGGRAGHGERRRDRGRGRPPLKAPSKESLADLGKSVDVIVNEQSVSFASATSCCSPGPGHAQPRRTGRDQAAGGDPEQERVPGLSVEGQRYGADPDPPVRLELGAVQQPRHQRAGELCATACPPAACARWAMPKRDPSRATKRRSAPPTAASS